MFSLLTESLFTNERVRSRTGYGQVCRFRLSRFRCGNACFCIISIHEMVVKIIEGRKAETGKLGY